MRILLDSHILFWAMDQEDRLPKNILEEINDPKNDVFYSVLSVWELTLKNLKNPIMSHALPLFRSHFTSIDTRQKCCVSFFDI